MATYPGGVYSPRTKENKAGIVYEPNKKTIVFVEDINNSDAEIIAIENELGTNIKGGFADLKARIVDLEARVTALGG